MTVNEADVAMAYLLSELEYELTNEQVTCFQDINDELVMLRKRLDAREELNGTLLVATTAYQIRMAEQEMTIYDLNKQVADMQAEMVRQSDKLQFLSALESAGVDNWQGYSHAYEILDEWKEEDATS